MTSQPRILIVDDDTDLRETLADVLVESGYHVTSAFDGQDALERLAASSDVDVILLDLMMPRMDGWEFRTRQREDPALAAIPVIVFSAYALGKDKRDELSAQGFLKKPVRLGDLLAELQRLVPTRAA